MGFVKDAARIGTGHFLSKKKKPESPTSSMISTTPYERPMSMIGSSDNRGGRRY